LSCHLRSKSPATFGSLIIEALVRQAKLDASCRV
jgi:hypothetical protein